MILDYHSSASLISSVKFRLIVCLCPRCVSGGNRAVPVGAALASVLEGADLKTTKRAAAMIAFFDAFEEGIYLLYSK